MPMRRCRLPLVLLTLLGFTTSCASDSVVDVPLEVANLLLSGSRPSILVGETMQLQATPQSESGKNLTARPVTWSTSDASVADVSPAGLVTGRADGTATITARSGNATRTADLTVIAPPRIALSASSVVMNGVEGLTNPAPAQVIVTNSGGGTLSNLTYSVTYPGGGATGWLQLTPSGTTAPATLTHNASVQGLAAGTYNATVTVAASAAANSPQQVDVQLVVAPSFVLAVGGTGSGTVTGTSINCVITNGATSGPCAQRYPGGTVITLTASPAAGNQFLGWAGGCTPAGSTCVATMTANRNVTAHFNPPPVALTVAGAGNGNGTVTGPAGSGIDCTITSGSAGGNCTALFAPNSTVLLTATAAAGHTFTGWGGGICSGTATTCSVSMSANRTVSASFSAPDFTVTVTPNPHQLVVGWQWQYGATVRQANGTVVPGALVTWASSNPGVATVNGSGLVVAVSAGTTTIRATHMGATGQATLTVASDPCAAISLYPPSVRIDAVLNDQSCLANILPAHYFAFSSTQPFSMRLSLTSTEFRMSSYWYVAQGLVPGRTLGGLIAGPTATSHQNLAILPAGNFAVEVRSADGRHGAYTADFEWGDRHPDVTLCQFAFVMTPVDYSGSINGNDCLPRTGSGRGHYDRFVINLRPSETITIRLVSASFDTYLELRDQVFNLVTADDNGGGGTNSQLVFTAGPQGGLFVIETTSAGPGASGNYRLTVDSNMTGAMAAPLFEPGFVNEPAVPAVMGAHRSLQPKPVSGGNRGGRR